MGSPLDEATITTLVQRLAEFCKAAAKSDMEEITQRAGWEAGFASDCN
jgi:hypothetical protein